MPSSIQQYIQDGTFGRRWVPFMWRELEEDRPGEWEILAKYLDKPAVECHSLNGVVSYILDDDFGSTDDEITHALMRLEIVKPLHNALTMQGTRSKITYGPVTLLANDELPSYANQDEQEELDEMEWSDEPTVEWNLLSHRTLLQDLIKNGTLLLMERGDSFLLRADLALRQVEIGHCAECKFFGTNEQGTSWCRAMHQPTAPDAPAGKYCEDFAPKPIREVTPSDLYVRIDPENIYLPPYTSYGLYMNGEEVEKSSAVIEDLKQQLRENQVETD